MMNQGESTGTITSLDRGSLEKHQVVDPHQVYTPSYYPPSSGVVSWNTQGENHSLRENGIPSDQPTSRNVQDGMNAASIASTSGSGDTNVAQGYNSYAAYPNTDPYGYSSTGYAPYYNGYQQQPNQYQPQSNQYQPQPNQYQPQSNQYPQQSSQYPQQSSQYPQQSSQYPQQSSQYPQQSNQYPQQSNQYPQQSNEYQQQSNQPYSNHAGTYQNTGAAYQPLPSAQNTGPTSYSSTYYNPADYQTPGSYTTGAAYGQQYTAYNSHQYPNYTPDSNSAYSSTTAAANSHSQQHYKQWEDYYSQSQTEVSCAPGTENISVSSASSLSSVPVTSTGYTASNNQTPGAYPPYWMPEATSSQMTSVQFQSVTASGSIPEGYMNHGASVLQNGLSNPVLPHVEKPLNLMPTYGSFQNQQNYTNFTFSQGSTTPHPPYQVSQSYQSSFQTASQPLEPLDSRRVGKMQIPTNPRIASNLPSGIQKTEKDSSTVGTAEKPAYIGVSMQKPNEKVLNHDATDSMIKPAMFPKSLRGYVERVLARCKDDRQMAACQALMKEVITKATADGTLYTKDWDTEPIFPLPNADVINMEGIQFSTPTSSMLGNKRSPSRRSKSRWEPVQEENLVKKSATLSYETAKNGGWNKQFTGGKTDNKEYNLGMKFSSSDKKTKYSMRPAKKQRFDDGGGDDSSNSDKEHSLTKYYSAAIAIADSPEEKKRRENRSKRFEKKHGNRAENNNFRAKKGNVYTRQASAVIVSRTVEESGIRAVEDIDWDALTVKGTCQEIEKRYLRLTSAPDPTTVRPEDVLERALIMVQNSPKNYLYKCDQLKSIRQDLTVQRIRNELTVKVYETHARLSIEVGDLPEFNQCQSQLQTLYAEGIKGCHMEFAAYNLLCLILHSNNNRDLLAAMSRLSTDAKKDEAVKHALSVRAAVTSGNYVMFFRLYKTAPNINTVLMDLYVEKMRYAAVKCISRSYRPTVPVSYLSQILGFTTDDNELSVVDECADWLTAHGAVLTSDNSAEMLLDAKASASSLYMPEPEDAVAHGDANLAVNDFFTRSLV